MREAQFAKNGFDLVDISDGFKPPRRLTDRVVDLTPAFDRLDVAVHSGEVAPIVTTEMWLPPASRHASNVAGPLVVAATVLLDRLEAEYIRIAPEREEFGFDLSLDPDPKPTDKPF